MKIKGSRNMSKREAIELARQMRQDGKTVKVYRHEGIYTQPGVGIETFVNYFVREVA